MRFPGRLYHAVLTFKQVIHSIHPFSTGQLKKTSHPPPVTEFTVSWVDSQSWLTFDPCSPQVPAQPAGWGDGALVGAEAGDGLPAQEADGAGGAALGKGAGAGQVGRAPLL